MSFDRIDELGLRTVWPKLAWDEVETAISSVECFMARIPNGQDVLRVETFGPLQRLWITAYFTPGDFRTGEKVSADPTPHGVLCAAVEIAARAQTRQADIERQVALARLHLRWFDPPSAYITALIGTIAPAGSTP